MFLLFRKGARLKVRDDIYYCETDDVEAESFIRDGFVNRKGVLVLPRSLIIIYNGLGDHGFDEFIIGQDTYEFAEIDKNMFEEI